MSHSPSSDSSSDTSSEDDSRPRGRLIGLPRLPTNLPHRLVSFLSHFVALHNSITTSAWSEILTHVTFLESLDLRAFPVARSVRTRIFQFARAEVLSHSTSQRDRDGNRSWTRLMKKFRTEADFLFELPYWAVKNVDDRLFAVFEIFLAANLETLDLSRMHLRSYPIFLRHLDRLYSWYLNGASLHSNSLASPWFSLGELDLSNNGLTKLGYRDLLPPNLRTLILSQNRLQWMTGAILRLPKLRHLDVRDNPLRKETATQMRKAMAYAYSGLLEKATTAVAQVPSLQSLAAMVVSRNEEIRATVGSSAPPLVLNYISRVAECDGCGSPFFLQEGSTFWNNREVVCIEAVRHRLRDVFVNHDSFQTGKQSHKNSVIDDHRHVGVFAPRQYLSVLSCMCSVRCFKRHTERVLCSCSICLAVRLSEKEQHNIIWM
ncbi:hypothetical protein BJ742DRAFT_811136 [Cladochytrium replicatum]|nr:hypothetical protein BJ742DRAFT_811136 [Cladochytrium replicatum]